MRALSSRSHPSLAGEVQSVSESAKQGVTVTTSITTALLRERALAPLASDIPVGMTIAEHRQRRATPSRWERARVAILGSSAVGIAGHALRSAHTER